ncbi:MAG: polynucleotide adenylyltransferase PcnB [Oceanococcus sp.]
MNPITGFFRLWSLVISDPVRIPRPEHSISRSRLSRAALQTLYGLKDAGYEALLVGGGVRDLLVGLNPKDFDVATNAEPEQVRDVFRRSRLIGRRFRLAHVRFGPEIIEVATFRAAPRSPDEEDVDEIHAVDEALQNDEPTSSDEDHLLDERGRILRDNVYGNMEQDAFRRDFTINALYYDIRDFAVVDYVGGMQDLADKKIRLIGDPVTRYREDPVRMLRAVRFASKLGFEIEQSAAEPIAELTGLLADVPPARLFDEMIKLLLSPQGEANFDGMSNFGLFQVLFPTVASAIENDDSGATEKLIRLALQSTAKRMGEDKPVTPSFIYAAMLWRPVCRAMQALLDSGTPAAPAMAQAASAVVSEQCRTVAIPKRFSGMCADMWHLQARFESRRGKRPYRMLEHKRFRAAYDFLLLRAEIGEVEQELADWWTRFQEVDESEREDMIQAAPSGPKPSGRRRKRRRSA